MATSSSACLPPKFDVETPAEDASLDGEVPTTAPEAEPIEEVGTDAEDEDVADDDDGSAGQADAADVGSDDGSAGQADAADVGSDVPEARPGDDAPDTGCNGACCPDCRFQACGASDGCGQLCGDGYCPPPQTCGGGGTPYVCGCTGECSQASRITQQRGILVARLVHL